MTDQLNEAQVLEDLTKAMTFSHDGQEVTPALNIPAADMANFAKIGALMTDKETCLKYLAQLNSILLNKVNAIGLRRRGKYLRGQKRELQKHNVTFTTAEGDAITGQYYKTNSVLSEFLEQWESSNGFNQASQVDGQALPDRSAELTAFVDSNHFRKYLLKHGYHWTDMAVAARHGDFTHRLHWYIVCEHNIAQNNAWLSQQPVDVFKKCGEPNSVNPNNRDGERYTIWDQLFDNSEFHQNYGNRALNNRNNAYRCPENLHKDLKSEAFRKRKDMWVLSQIIYSRSECVVTVKKNAGNPIDDVYIAYENNAPGGVIMVGDKTGAGTPHPGTIMWNNIQAKLPVGWNEDLIT